MGYSSSQVESAPDFASWCFCPRHFFTAPGESLCPDLVCLSPARIVSDFVKLFFWGGARALRIKNQPRNLLTWQTGGIFAVSGGVMGRRDLDA